MVQAVAVLGCEVFAVVVSPGETLSLEVSSFSVRFFFSQSFFFALMRLAGTLLRVPVCSGFYIILCNCCGLVLLNLIVSSLVGGPVSFYGVTSPYKST